MQFVQCIAAQNVCDDPHDPNDPRVNRTKRHNEKKTERKTVEQSEVRDG